MIAGLDRPILADASTTPTGHAEGLARYRQLRQAGIALSTRLVKMLSREDMEEGARKLGMLERGVIVMDSEDTSAVLMDYCLHEVRRQGITAIERFLQVSPPPADSVEMILLQAQRASRYSLYVVEGVKPGIGVALRDLIRDEPLFLYDVGLSRSAEAGLVLASRVFMPEGIAMTTGASLPAGLMPAAARNELFRHFAGLLPGGHAAATPEQLTQLTTKLMRECLQRGAAKQVAYEDLDDSPRHSPSMIVSARVPIGRNDPCRCGSGIKFKRCCGMKR